MCSLKVNSTATITSLGIRDDGQSVWRYETPLWTGGAPCNSGTMFLMPAHELEALIARGKAAEQRARDATIKKHGRQK